MKSITLLSVLAVGTSLAGEPAVYDKNPVMPPAPTLYSWFAGVSAGYLIENDEEMYTLHVGVDLPEQFAGWDQALYLEVGYAELSGHSSDLYDDYYYYYNDDYNDDYATVSKGPSNSYARYDLEIIPVTLNWKLEKPVTQTLNAYTSIGAGVAFMEGEARIGSSRSSDDDLVFYAQATGGVLYNVNQSFEVFGGARLIYFDDPEFNLFGTSTEFHGVDNVDVLLEVGGRVNF